VLGSLELHTD